jgi:hypothetical protein
MEEILEVWRQREEWIEDEVENAMVGGYAISDYALALFQDMSRAYCAGAWISVIIVSISIIDAYLREDIGDNEIKTAKLLNDFYEGEDINWLRKLRNRYVHHNINKPVLDVDSYMEEQGRLEQDATNAVKMVINALFQNPFV